MNSKKPGPGWGTLEPNSAPAALLILCCERRLYPRFATVSNTLNMLLQVSTTMFVAVGMTFAIASAWHRPHGRLHHGIGFNHCGIAYQSGDGDCHPAALSAALLIGLLWLSHLTSET